MATKVVRIDAQMNKALAKVLEEIQTGVAFASIGERFSKADINKLPEDDTTIKFPLTPIGKDAIPEETINSEVKEKFAQYCKRYSIIAMVTACEIYLQTILLIIELLISLKDKKKISFEELNLLKQEWRTQLWELGGLSLLDKCTSLLDNMVEEINNRKYFADINKMRRCIVHRGGIVSEQDVDDSGVLQITLLKPELFTDDVVIDKLPFKLEKGGTLKFRLVEDTLSWNIRQSIEPTIGHCQSIAYSLIMFCSEVNKKIGQSVINIIKSNPDSFPPQAQ